MKLSEILLTNNDVPINLKETNNFIPPLFFPIHHKVIEYAKNNDTYSLAKNAVYEVYTSNTILKEAINFEYKRIKEIDNVILSCAKQNNLREAAFYELEKNKILSLNNTILCSDRINLIKNKIELDKKSLNNWLSNNTKIIPDNLLEKNKNFWEFLITKYTQKQIKDNDLMISSKNKFGAYSFSLSADVYLWMSDNRYSENDFGMSTEKFNEYFPNKKGFAYCYNNLECFSDAIIFKEIVIKYNNLILEKIEE
ncbi:MAG: hypothetical protein PHN56_03025 [Candidatus Nanoarchaeia archaeon]|nr:hypothetical protein [Candidatus Nanoarchaeia archaeon]